MLHANNLLRRIAATTMGIARGVDAGVASGVGARPLPSYSRLTPTRTARGLTRLRAGFLSVVLVSGLGAVAGTVATTVAAPAAAFASSTVGGKITRSEVLARAQFWADLGQPYSPKGSGDHPVYTWSDDPQGRSYRNDCSGLVSMAWHATTSFTTDSFPGSGLATKLASIDDLKPGDAIHRSGHMELFAFWANEQDHTKGAYVYSFNQPNEAVRSPHKKNNFGNIGKNEWPDMRTYDGWRYDNIVDDPQPDRAFREVAGMGDLTGDGRPDMLAVQPVLNGGTLWLYPGKAGGFSDRKPVGSNWDTMRELTGIGFANADGYPDLLAVEKSTGKLWLYPGAADGTLGDRVLIGSGGWNAMHDLTAMAYTSSGDRYPDLVAVEQSTGKLWLYPGNGSGGFDDRQEIGSGGWNGMTELTGVGDLTRDGWNDLLAVEKSTGKLWLYPGNGTGGFGDRRQLGTNWDSMRSLTGIGDLTGDGIVDLTAIEEATGKLWLYPGNTSGGLGDRQLIGTSYNG